MIPIRYNTKTKRNATSKGCKLPDYKDIVPIKDDIVTDVRAV